MGSVVEFGHIDGAGFLMILETAGEDSAVTLVWTRVDQKLIHGQISIGWVPHLAIDAIVVAAPDIVGDTWAQKVMMMGLPPEVRLAGFSYPDKLAELLEAAEYRDRRVMVIFKDIEGVLEAVSSGFKLERLNLGNHASQYPDADVRLADSFYASSEELEELGRLQRGGLEVLLQALPTGRAVHWKPRPH